jgi:hypothetical protein
MVVIWRTKFRALQCGKAIIDRPEECLEADISPSKGDYAQAITISECSAVRLRQRALLVKSPNEHLQWMKIGKGLDRIVLI